MKKVTLVIPCFNEEKNIFPFFDICKETLNNNFKYEYVFVNDGSRDKTLESLRNLINQNPTEEIIAVNFSRNFGKESAILAGLKNASGDYISLIDADMQQHPKYVNEMVEILENNEDLDLVAAYQKKRKEGKILTGFKSLFYSLINKISDTKFEKNASDFRTFRKNVAESIINLDEYHRFSKGLFSWVGFNTHFIPYEVEERKFGKSTWSFRSLTKYAIEGFVGYSTVPLKFATFLGMMTSLISLIYMFWIIIQKLFIGIQVEGYATIVTLILLLSGVQLICIGILGEYLAKTYIEVKKRPHYIIKNILKNNK